MVYEIYIRKPLDIDIEESNWSGNSDSEDQSMSEAETTFDAEDSFWDNLPEFCSFCRLFCNNQDKKGKELPCLKIICKVDYLINI